MDVIKSNGSYIVKLFINHFVSGVYSLVLYIVLSVAFEGKYIIAGSILSILFYLYLIYTIRVLLDTIFKLYRMDIIKYGGCTFSTWLLVSY